MKGKVILILLFFFLALTIPIGSCYEDEGTDLNLTYFPLALADKLSISEFAGGILASMILTLAFVLPTAIWSKTLIPPLFIGILSLGACISFGWLDYWFLILIAMLIALMFGSKMSGIITGGRLRG